ncbi:MAG: glycosyltransferase [Holophagae bacterium]|jgi:glycosyltransferase involved in cell wall biosynthesis
MSVPVLSIVIPTRNRRDILMVTLRALGHQRGLDGRFQVIVVDDGSTDGTEKAVRDSFFEAFDQTMVAAGGAGPARARNLGIAAAAADRVLLLGDDTIPTSRALAHHLEAAGGREVAVQGRIEWDPDRPTSDVMAFLAPAGPQFWFRGLVDGGTVPWSQVLGSNLSAPTDWFRAEPFDERFTDACMEDTELAWRWRCRGWSVVWSDRAVCHHHHHYDDIEPFVDRQRRAGRWARLAIRLHPTMAFKLAGEPLLALPRKAVADAVRRLIGRGRRADAWDLRCRIAYLRGVLFGS